MVSKKAKYALRALIYLARRQGEGPVLIARLASDENIPRKFLERILLDLNNAGILQSKKGKGGGYSLQKPPDTIRVSDILRLMDGPLAPVSCVSKTAYVKCTECGDEDSCPIRSIMNEVHEAITTILDGKTLSDMVKMSKESQRSWGYVI